MPDDPELPDSPFTAFTQAAVGLHEWFTSLVDAGFTRGEAITLIATVITKQAGGEQ